MEARARQPHRMVQAFTGREFVSYEWRPVPAGAGEEAKRLEAGGVLELRHVLLASAPVVEVDATPSAVKLAEEYDIDLGGIIGTGAGGRILKSDIWDAIEDEEE